MWHCHGGSGTNLTLSDILEMEYSWFRSWLEWADEQRDSEAAAIKKAKS